MELSSLKYHYKSRGHKVKTYGRGRGSGMGGTSTRGNNGQHQRKSGNTRLGFEGGQTPIYRRLPKVGFQNVNSLKYAVVTLKTLSTITNHDEINLATLKEERIIPQYVKMFKIIGSMELSKAYKVECDMISKQAQACIENAKGSVTLVPKKANKTERVFASKKQK